MKNEIRALIMNPTEREFEKHSHTVLYCIWNKQNAAIDQTLADFD